MDRMLMVIPYNFLLKLYLWCSNFKLYLCLLLSRSYLKAALNDFQRLLKTFVPQFVDNNVNNYAELQPLNISIAINSIKMNSANNNNQ